MFWYVFKIVYVCSIVAYTLAVSYSIYVVVRDVRKILSEVGVEEPEKNFGVVAGSTFKDTFKLVAVGLIPAVNTFVAICYMIFLRKIINCSIDTVIDNYFREAKSNAKF